MNILNEEELYKALRDNEKRFCLEELIEIYLSSIKEYFERINSHYIISIAKYSRENKLRISDSWETNADKEYGYVSYFDKAVAYVNKYNALSFTNLIYDCEIDVLKLYVKTNGLIESETKLRRVNIDVSTIVHIIENEISVHTKEFSPETINTISSLPSIIACTEEIINDLSSSYILESQKDIIAKINKESLARILSVYAYFFHINQSSIATAYFLNSQNLLAKDKLSQILILQHPIDEELPKILLGLRTIIHEGVFEQLKKAQVKSAKAAIMARNISHNLGSHVMYYLNLKLSSVNSILKENVLKDLLKHSSTGLTCQLSISANLPDCSLVKTLSTPNKDSLSLPFLIGLGRFINYLQERMDYIATISTDYVPYCMPVNFKDSIYDELNYDLKIERHKEFQEFKNKKVENLLLDYIARSEGLNRNDISLNFELFNGKEREHEDLQKLRDVQVDLPGGEIGRQAFFSIIENIIRNAAKHSGASNSVNGKKLVFTISTAECPEFSDLIKISITDNIQHDSQLCKPGGKIHKANEEDYVNQSGQLNESGKGIKEMRISASWLRCISDERDVIPKVLQPSINIDGNLVFEFYLLKPQHVAVICNRFEEIFKQQKLFDDTDDFESFFTSLNQELGKIGWTLYRSKDYIKAGSRHKIVAIDTNIETKDYTQTTAYCHSRVVQWDTSLIDLSRTNGIGDELYTTNLFSQLYKMHIESILKISGSCLQHIGIDDEKVLGNHPKCTDEYGKHTFVKPYGMDVDSNNVRTKNSAIFITKGEITGDDFNIIFKKHFLSEPGDKNLITDEYQFIESITGHNSTDRLIRNGKLDKNWYYQMNEAAQTRIAIFDERLWADFSGVSNDDIEDYFSSSTDQQADKEFSVKLGSHLETFVTGDEYNAKPYGIKLNALHECIISFFALMGVSGKFQYDEFSRHYEDFEENKIDLESLIKTLSAYVASNRRMSIPLCADEENTLLLDKKFVTIFNVVKCTDNKFAIIRHDFNSDLAKDDVKNETNQVVGWIKKDQDQKIVIAYKPKGKYHFISIHQGILDKIYDCFGLKSQIESNSEGMNMVTEEFRQTFCYLSGDHKINQLVVHSGRSRPAEEDMPQKVPFVQFSAISNALKDCKFSLSEVFYAARYSKY
ncbi:MAG: hypothetical protein NT040_10535 [Bacteroidetes bacterium]|nr:hypothetical protein [Bacteroidota bacterium]